MTQAEALILGQQPFFCSTDWAINTGRDFGINTLNSACLVQTASLKYVGLQYVVEIHDGQKQYYGCKRWRIRV